jgi:hypothetical protein
MAAWFRRPAPLSMAAVSGRLSTVQTLAADRADEPLREGTLPRTAGSREHLLDLHALHALAERVTVDRVAIAEEISGGGGVREAVHELLGCPCSRGMLGDVDVEDSAPMVSEDDQDEKHSQVSGRNGEEVDRDQVLDMVVQERAPGLRWRCPALRDQARDRALGHVDAELKKLPMDPGRATQWIRGGHFSDEGDDLGVDGRGDPR